MKANSVHSNQSPLEDYRSRLLRLRAFMNENLLVQLNKTEYHSHSVFETQKTLKSALTCLQKNNLNDEVIVKVEELLVDKSDRNKACQKAYFDFLKEVKASRKYTNFKPSTLEIIGQRSHLPIVTNKPVTQKLDFIKIMEQGVAQVEQQTRGSGVESIEINQILSKIRNINNDPKIIEIANENGPIKEFYTKVKKAEYKDSVIFYQGPPISRWDLSQVSDWARQMHEHKEVANSPKMLPEMIAVINRAVILHEKYEPRTVQLVSLISSVIDNDKGKLLQISTGEGKSTTTAMLGVLQGLKGKNVDIITSSRVLAKRDATDWAGFYNIFNLSCSHNIEQAHNKGVKACYKDNIVYGDSLHFQSDLIRDEYKLHGTRGERDFANSVVLIDEVDSMLIDESGKIAKLATPSPGMEYLAPIFVTSFNYLKQVINYFQEQKEDIEQRLDWLQDNVENYIKKVVGADMSSTDIEQISVPKHLQGFVQEQAGVWAKSAIDALNMQEKRDYLIREVAGKRVIAPVDYTSTGVIQEHTHWSNGLHQYLQIKHSLAMTPEGLTTSFMSNMAYFKRYGDNIYGMSGTLGSKSEQELLKRVYGVDIAFIPTFAEKLFTEVPAIITDSSKEQYQAIAASAHEITSKRRATLILAETIDDVENIKEALIQAGIESIKTYTTGSAEENEQVIKDRANSGDVIIATNLAGRGTDIKLSNLVKSTGGLHVILSFLPSNLRVEEQGYGRCARAGVAGSGQMILNATYESLKLHGANLQEHPRHLNEVDILKARRDLAEELRLQDIEKQLVPKIELEDEMFKRFKALSHELKRSEDNPYKQSQLEELWGLWFKQISNKLDNAKTGKINREEILAAQAEFISKTRTDYATGNIMQNPAYLNQEAVNLFGKWNQYDSSVEILHKADSVAGDYGYATSYNLAYCYFRQNAEHPKKNDERLINGAIEHLSKALSHLEGVIIPQLHMMQILVGSDQISTDLSLQIDAKLNLHKTQSEYIRNAFRKIEEGLGQGKVIVVNNKDTRPVFDIVGQTPSTASEEVLEIARQGIVQNYVLEARDPPKDVLSAIAVGVLGVSQFIVGALVTVASAGSATALGVSMMMSGAQDIYHGVRAAMGKEVINWGDYWTNKGISYAISIISMGWENFKAGLSAIKEQAGRIADAGRNFFAGTASKVMGKQAASEIAKGTVKESVSEVSKTTFTSIASDFIAKEGMRTIVLEVGKNILTQNITNVVAKQISKQLEGEKEDIRENAYSQIMDTLNSEPVASHINHLISLDKINGHNFYTGKIKQEAYRLLTPKADRISSLARTITSAAMSGMASRSGSMGASIAIGTMSKAAEIAEANKQIKNLVGEFCDDLRNSISRIAQEANNTMPSVMFKLMPQYTVKPEEVTDIIDILAANKVLDTNSMQFNHQFLQPLVNFEAGLVFSTTLPEPEVANPIYHNGQIVNKPPREKIQAFQIEEIKRNAQPEPKNIEEIDFGPFRRVRDRIIKVSRDISAKQREENQAEKQALAEELAGRAADRTVGIIRHNIIAPLAAPIVGLGVDQMAKGFMDTITKPERFMGARDSLEEQFLLENYRRAGFAGIGVAAGDEMEAESKKGEQLDNEEKNDNQLIKTKKSKSLFATRNNTVIDRVIEKTFSIFADKYDQSLDESQKHENISSVNLFAERNREINANVSAIRRGNGHAVFKNTSEFNETMGGTIRYIFDQASHISHVVSPEVTGLFNAATGTMGHGVTELYQLTIPDNTKKFLSESYYNMMGQFPTENQRFLVQTTMGVLAGQMTAKGINLAIVNKANNPKATSALSTSNAALETERKLAIVVTHNAQNVNSLINLNKKMSALQKAQTKSIKTLDLGDGRVRYYEKEIPSKKLGPTRGASYVTEHNQLTGQVRSWHECYDHSGTINRVHPKMIDGQDIKGQHYPPTKEEILIFLKQNKY